MQIDKIKMLEKDFKDGLITREVWKKTLSEIIKGNKVDRGKMFEWKRRS